MRAASRLLTVLLFVALLVVPAPTRSSAPLVVTIIDVGQGDSILIQAPDGQTALIDGGDAGTGALAYLQSHGVRHLDLMVATHPHSDHIGGLVDVLKSIPTDEVITNGRMNATPVFERFLDAIAAARARYVEARTGDKVPWGGLAFDVLSGGFGGDLNGQSLVLRLVDDRVSFLFMGDANQATEGNLLASGQPVSSTILKVGHHGSGAASSRAFLAAVAPKVAVYSCGVGNGYGHPDAETLAALHAVGTEVHGTDLEGTLAVTTDGLTYHVVAGGKGPAPVVAPPAPPTIVPVVLARPRSSDGCAYVASKNSNVFHVAGCGSAAKIKPSNKICFATRAEAVASGRRPCKECKP